MKLLLCNLRESGKNILVLDPEQEYHDLCDNLGGTYIDMMSGEYMINPLEPKSWTDGEKGNKDEPEAFRKISKLSQHISYLKDFFRAYKLNALIYITLRKCVRILRMWNCLRN